MKRMYALLNKISLLGLAILAISFFTACGTKKTPQPHQPVQKPQPQPQPSPPKPKPIDVRAQQQFYDSGLLSYSREDYIQAKNAFQRVIELGPNSVLGQKSQENLKKIQQILRTVKEIESK